MRPNGEPWDGRFDRDAYIANRIALLAKALMDHSMWRRSLRRFETDASLAVTWVDHEGRRHVTAVNRAFLGSHLKILRSLTYDLSSCGEVGNRALRGLFARQLTTGTDEGEAG